MSEETVTFNVVYNVNGINESIRGTQRYLFFMNALRLSAQDIQQVMSGPTLQNVLWTTIQLTRAWTAFHRIVKATNQEQQRTVAGGLLRQTVGGAATRSLAFGQSQLSFGAGGTLGITSTAQTGFVTALAASLGISVFALGGLAAGAVAGAGAIYLKHRQVKLHRRWRERQREVARSQGLEF